MRRTLYNLVPAMALLAVSAGTALHAEDLDAALEAQKKKARRMVYSEQATLAKQDLTVPKSPTEEERELDRKLRELDAREEARPPAAFNPAARSATVPVNIQKPEDKNWLVQAVLDQSASQELTNTAADDWLRRELDRRRELEAQEQITRETERVNRLMNEQIPAQDSSPAIDSLKKFESNPLDFISGTPKPRERESYLRPDSRPSDTLTVFRPQQKKTAEAALSPFAPRPSGLISPTTAGRDPQQRYGTAPSPFTPENNPLDPLTPPPPKSPLEIIRKSSPIYRADPFGDAPLPEFKKSIWE